MYPKILDIPFTNLTIWSYGVMMVIGFISAMLLIRYLSRNITPDPQYIINAALYSLIAGVVGARIFYVIHYFDRFRSDLLSVFAIWEGGLELLGGVILAIVVICVYLRYHKLPVRQYLDILAIALMLALTFGRMGCFFRGCCFGKPTDVPWAIRFPYNSPPFLSQIEANPQRNRPEPQLKLPSEFFGYIQSQGSWHPRLKPYDSLNPEQKEMVTRGVYRCLPTHPTQLYSSANGVFLSFVLYFFWRRSQRKARSKAGQLFRKPGCTFGLMFVVYGVTRFFMEFVRDDNPFEFEQLQLTVSQNIGIGLVILGAVLMVIFERVKPAKAVR